jgi:hypothetical protein
MPQAEALNLWKMLSMQGDQSNPAMMSQMAAQATPPPADPSQMMSMMPPQAPPPPPQVTPAPPQKIPQSAQPTTQPIGTLPQEIVPSQQPLAAGAPVGSQQWMLERLLSQTPTMSPEMERQMKLADQNASASMGRQDAALDQQKAALADYTKADRGTDFRPLAALVDSMFGGGGNFGKAAEGMAPESAAKKMENRAQMLQQITQNTGALTKDQLDYVRQKLQQQSYVENRTTKQDIAKNADLTKLTTAGMSKGTQDQRMDLQKQRLAQQVGKEARGTVNNDPILKTFTPRLEGAAKIGELIQGAREGKVVNNQALLGQLNAEIARLETGSQSPGLGQSEKTELESAKAQLGALRDRVTGKPSDSVSPEILDTAGKMVNELSGSYMKGIDSRMIFLGEGMTPEQKSIVADKHKSLKDTYSPRFGGWRGLDEGVDNLDHMSDEDLLKAYNAKMGNK